ncbi:MAG: ATP-binding cassette domain-containing protein [Anaerolineae bacterium]|nr:ATP-binding cassette domain-containing protein [Anaerolineae bacterium]
MTEPMVATFDLVKSFAVRRGFFAQRKSRLVAVDRVTLTINVGETLGLVGESGCGKSTLGLTLMQLYEPTSGQVRFDGKDLVGMPPAQLNKVRRKMQMIYQDPYASLDPRMNVEEILTEPLVIHEVGSRQDRLAEAQRLLDVVGLPGDALGRFPSEFSGGQQQRIGIARALMLQPKMLICDEPVSSLDVSVQAQILNLLRDLQAEFGLTYLFISHNIAVTRFISRRIGVMYLGRLVEIGPSAAIVDNPLHPYTQALIAAVPDPHPSDIHRQRKLSGDVPSPIDRPTGCAFHPRCRFAASFDEERCSRVEPQLRALRPDHAVACHFAERITAQSAPATHNPTPKVA